jgi:hypothetical protein
MQAKDESGGEVLHIASEDTVEGAVDKDAGGSLEGQEGIAYYV